MTQTELQTETAARRSRRESPLSVYIAVIKEKPEAGQKVHRQLLRERIKSELYEEYLDALIDEWERLNYSTALQAAFPPSKKDLEAKAKERKEQRVSAKVERELREDVEVETIKAQVVKNLLDHAMTNGKQLRDCTGAECVAEGGFFTKIGKIVGPSRIVGKVMTAADLTALIAKRAKK